MPTAGSGSTSPERAPQACTSCRKQKRKCDKALPACALCTRLKRECDYFDTSSAGSSDDLTFLRQKVQELEQRLNGVNGNSTPSTNGNTPDSLQLLSNYSGDSSLDDFIKSCLAPDAELSPMNVFFLDSWAFKEGELSINMPKPHVPPEILMNLGYSGDMQALVELYFSNIHTWFPIVSKKRLSQTMSNPTREPGPDMILLFLCMKLVTTYLPLDEQDTRIPLYWTTKQYFSIVESSGVFSVRIVQATLLIAIYEIGHCIYPAAYLTVGAAARLGHAIGLHDRKNAPQMLKRPISWTEYEEARRTWWGVVILERYVNSGALGRPLATEEPLQDDMLPSDDNLWDQGEMNPAGPLYVSSDSNIPASTFARTCQAAHILGRVLRHRNDQSLDCSYRLAEALQLIRTVEALQVLLNDESTTAPQRMSTAVAICYSAFEGICDPYSCGKDGRYGIEQIELQKAALEGLKNASRGIFEFIRRLRQSFAFDLAAISPLILDCVYASAATHAWIVTENGDPECLSCYNEEKDFLGLISTRWRAADQPKYSHYRPSLPGARGDYTELPSHGYPTKI
ncbi:MAG: hypothetical protein M1834_008975 [Cirrosporium novae-zelandiae]|nr:MAG: hypothetical protein M1834_008975 [Cirrosporium novae-zelandiae]